MFRLLKLAMYAFVGYALYELYQGMISEPQRGYGGNGGAEPEGFSDSFTRSQNLTGAGAGQSIETLDSDGGSQPHRVGRGVMTT